MKLEDIKVGMKVKLISKKGGVPYGSIEKFYNEKQGDCCIDYFEINGYGVVLGVYEEDGVVGVGCSLCPRDGGWEFLPEDLEPYVNRKTIDEATIEELEQRLKELKGDKRGKAQNLAIQATELLAQVKTMGFEYCSSELIGYGEVKVNIEIL